MDKKQIKEIEEYMDALGGIIIPPEDWENLKNRWKATEEINEDLGWQ